jgi:glycosyltransferase involved in cell wall biosynthesis
MISIITTAFNNKLYIKEALDSFIESCNGFDFEILIGIDHCKETLDGLLKDYPKLHSNIRIFFFRKKENTYIIRNTLAKNAKFDNLIFFDSDDVMRLNTVTNTIRSLSNGVDVVQFGFMAFSGTLKISKSGYINNKFSYHVGAFGIKKNVFLEMNGFEPWICAADGEFFWRLESNKYKIEKSNDINILYRRHGNNLTINPETGMNSPLRKSYHDKKKYKIDNNIKQPLDLLVISNYVKINEKSYNTYLNHPENYLEKILKCDISVIIPTYKNTEFFDECLDSVLKSCKNIESEILIGIDGCEDTFNFLKNKVFNGNVRVFNFEENNGPYIVRNTLSELSSSDLLLFFDSDDVMSETMIDEIIQLHKTKQVNKPSYVEFEKNINKKNDNVLYGEGVFSIEKNLLLSMNGFEPWKCGADSEFMNRLYKNNKTVGYTKKLSFFRRVHSNSLTQNPETGMSSQLRHHYFKLNKQKTNFGPLEKLTIANYNEISVAYDKIGVIIDNRLDRNKLVDNLIDKLNIKKTKEPSNNIDYDFINQVMKKNGVYNPNKNQQPKKELTPIDRNKLMEIKEQGNLTKELNKLFPKKPKRDNSLNIFKKY